MEDSGESPAPATPGGRRHDRVVSLVAVGLTLSPFVVAVVVLVVARNSYLPMSDHALTEMHVRDIGHHPVLVGLYSRDDWSHPGPMLFYLLAPFYWLTGGASIGLYLGAVAINAAAIGGIAYVAYRRGGVVLVVVTAFACCLLMRTSGADFVRDPWNNYVVTLPFGLLIFLVWAMTGRERWALPVGVVVASFLAQTHVGFVVLALPLLTVGIAWLTVSTLRSGDDHDRRALLRTGLWSLLTAGVLWLPVIVDAVVNHPSNTTRIIRYFQGAHDPMHSVGEGWRVVTSQFAAVPEWLTSHRAPTLFTAESSFLYSAPFPFVLVLMVVAGVGYRRMKRGDGLRLLATLAVAVGLGVVAVDRTLGPAYDYRLRWTWVLGMAGFVAVAWCLALAVERWRSHRGRRAVLVIGLAGIAACSVVNVTTAARAGVPQKADGKVLAALLPGVLADLDHDTNANAGQVVVDDPDVQQAAWYSRSLVLQLERRGYDARMPQSHRFVVGDDRGQDGGPVAARYVVASDREIAQRDADPTLRPVAKWSSVSPDAEHAFDTAATELDTALAQGRISGFEHFVDIRQMDPGNLDPAVAWAVAVYRVVTS